MDARVFHLIKWITDVRVNNGDVFHDGKELFLFNVVFQNVVLDLAIRIIVII